MTTQNIFDLVDTWNASGTTFTAVKMTVTDTSSATLSRLLSLGTAAGGELAGVVKDGSMFAHLGIWKSAATSYNGSNVYGISFSSGPVDFYASGTFAASFGPTVCGFFVPIGLSAASNPSSPDTILSRRAAANLRLGAADVGATTATVTITIAAPGVVTWSNHNFSTGTPVVFTTTGALPTGITSGTTYYAVVVDANTFQLASSVANAIAATPTVITTSGSQSGTHTGTRYNITQRLSMQSITGVTDRLGADLFIQGSQGTGTGPGGSIIFQVAPAGSTGTAQNALATALTISDAGQFTVTRIGSTASPYGTLATFQHGSSAWLTGLAYGGGGYAIFANNNVQIGAPGSNQNYGISLAAGTPIGWTSSTNGPNTALDVTLFRDTSNTLALRNGTAAQEMRVYETTTGTIYKAILGNRQLIKIAGAAFDNGAGASAGTLTNAPAVGNPTKWIPIDDNGTTRHIPAW